MVRTVGLKEFLSESSGKRVFISKRLKNETGGELKLFIKGLNENDIEDIRAFSEKDFVYEVIKKGCLEPKFLKNEEIEAGLLPGEAYGLYREIIKAGGLDKSFSELKKEVSLMLLRGEAEAVYGCLSAFEMGILPRDFTGLDRKEKACIGAFIDEKIRIRKRGGRL
ncbi:MAG: hypothetical protein LUD81_01700 [Clostridiales bacterium]|nr:hypothetical protein [Clostridiales bacterium]